MKSTSLAPLMTVAEVRLVLKLIGGRGSFTAEERAAGRRLSDRLNEVLTRHEAAANQPKETAR